MGDRGDFFDFYKKFAKFYFLARPDTTSYPTLYRILTPFMICFMCSPFISELIQMATGGSGEFSGDMLTFSVFLIHAIGTSRLLGYLWMKQDYEDIIEFIRRPSFDFNVFNYSSLSMLARNDDEQSVILRHPIDNLKDITYKNINDFCSKSLIFFAGYVHVNALISYTQNWFQPTYEKFNPILNRTSIYRDYVYLLWYPFDTSVSDGYYLLGFFYQPICFCSLMCPFICIYILDTSFILYLKGQADVLAEAITYVDRNVDETVSYFQIMKLKEIRLVKCINELQAIYKCSSMVNDLSAYPMLMQVFFSSVVSCGMMYRVDTVNTPGEYFVLYSTISVCCMLIFLMCWYYQEVTLSIMDIELKVIELDWLAYTHSLRTAVLFTITRLQYPFYFMMGHWTPINIGTFIGMVKMGYSCYMLVKSTTETEM
ncbi:putative odorant receptor 92a [Rhynchophorus ferrugineus]|uniref:putative odorant receptor 92a n=1 Tax=Rhynchophorus ferrugineus TaxID=354439 RepID=UPI003FCECA36